MFNYGLVFKVSVILAHQFGKEIELNIYLRNQLRN
ncbi:hypothetical protein SAMN05216464_101643 [Mucilaginibacter pineti]|uniref:Uncharacterized protein n=1 Tax=Mucilaginibacter pineti TaxID=1391627 RepID=A0A1G6UGQ8_9SPHI|nr:hypothetical protein SAMN05216464_101643 [Mucilaginibacter pineti]